jgi:hypothetical protein
LPNGFRVEALIIPCPAVRRRCRRSSARWEAGAWCRATVRLRPKPQRSSRERACFTWRSTASWTIAIHWRRTCAWAPSSDADGLLHLSEVAGAKLSASLVVLTACEAVSGKLYAGEGLVGLARAFLVSGARQVIASEWPVDASAAELTAALYRELARGRSSAAALRSAQLALLGSASTAHPIHWAGFVVFDGDTRQKTRR